MLIYVITQKEPALAGRFLKFSQTNQNLISFINFLTYGE